MVGIAARMRESSVTLPSSSGTLKSTRRNTRLPAASKSRIVSLSMGHRPWRRAERVRPRLPIPSWLGLVRSGGRALLDRLSSRHERDEIRDAAAVAPFVVVPADHLDHRAAQHHRRFRVDDRGATVAPEVGRYEGLVRYAQDALQRTGGGLAECGVDLLDGGRAAHIGCEIDDRDGGRRDPEAAPVESTLEVRDHE